MTQGVWRHKSDLAVVESESRTVVLDLDRLDVPPRLLQGPALLIWETLPGRTTEQVVAEVAAFFDLEPAEVADGVRTFLDDVAAVGLVLR